MLLLEIFYMIRTVSHGYLLAHHLDDVSYDSYEADFRLMSMGALCIYSQQFFL